MNLTILFLLYFTFHLESNGFGFHGKEKQHRSRTTTAVQLPSLSSASSLLVPTLSIVSSLLFIIINFFRELICRIIPFLLKRILRFIKITVWDEYLLVLLSFLLSLPDQFMAPTIWLARKCLGKWCPRLYSSGYGKNLSDYYQRVETLLESLRSQKHNEEEEGDSDNSKKLPRRAILELEKDDISWGEVEKGACGYITIQKGMFQSPCAEILPDESKRCHFHIVRPGRKHSEQSAGSHNNGEVFVIISAGTTEVGITGRYILAMRLALVHGYTSVIMSAPYYGERKPPYQTSWFIRSLADSFIMTQASVEEAAILCNYYLSLNKNNKVCFTGFSLGGGCAFGAATLALCLIREAEDGKRVGCAMNAPAMHYGTFLGSAIELIMNEDAIREDHDVDQWRHKFHTTLFGVTSAVFLPVLQERRTVLGDENLKMGSLKCASMLHDGVVRGCRTEETRIMMKHTPCFGEPTLKYIPGGHPFGFLFRCVFQYNLIIETIDELK